MQRLRENQMENNSPPFNNRAEGSFLSMQKSEEVARIGGKRRVKSGVFFFSTTFSSTRMKEGEKLWGNWWRDVPRRWEGADLSPEIRKKSRKEERPTKVRVRWFRSLALLELEKVSTEPASAIILMKMAARDFQRAFFSKQSRIRAMMIMMDRINTMEKKIDGLSFVIVFVPLFSADNSNRHWIIKNIHAFFNPYWTGCASPISLWKF